MAKITRFEDLICWQKSRKLVNLIYSMTSREPFSRDFGLKDQIRRVAVSTMTNIAEGFSRYHKKDFMRFLDIAQSSAAEVKSLCYVALDQNYISQDTFKKAQIMADEARQTTLGLLRYVKSTLEKKNAPIKETQTEYKSKFEINYLEIPNEHLAQINTQTQ